MPLQILYQDSDYVIIDKPSGMLVHPSPLNRDRVTCLNTLRDQIGQYLYPVHRLDRGASGVLCFALSPEAARSWKVKKNYLIVVRGFTQSAGEWNKPMKTAKGLELAALTRYQTLEQIVLPIAVGPYLTSRYSLVKVEIDTGRFHQIRKHFNSASHPVLGDTWYGDGKHNRSLKAEFGLERLMLFGWSMEFKNPLTGQTVRVQIEFPLELTRLGFQKKLPT